MTWYTFCCACNIIQNKKIINFWSKFCVEFKSKSITLNKNKDQLFFCKIKNHQILHDISEQLFIRWEQFFKMLGPILQNA